MSEAIEVKLLPPDQTPGPVTEKVVFSEVQQNKLDELIREAMSRAASQTKKELASALAEIEVLKGERSTLQTTSDKTKQEANATKTELLSARKQAAVSEALTGIPFVNHSQVKTLTEGQITWSAEHNRFVALGKDGSPLLGADGKEPLSLGEFYNSFGEKNPHLVRGTLKTGIGSREASQLGVEQTVTHQQRLRQLFGRGSSGKAANDLAKSDLRLYRQLKGEARALGLIA